MNKPTSPIRSLVDVRVLVFAAAGVLAACSSSSDASSDTDGYPPGEVSSDDAGATSESDGGANVGTKKPDGGSSDSSTPGSGTAVNGLSIKVSGNQLVDADGKTVTLRGADVSGTEFVCAQNYTNDAYGGAPLADDATFAAMKKWNINVIRLPLNEDCWLDINGVQIGGAKYQSAIQAEVKAAHDNGLFVILDLHWTAPGTQRALAQNPLPDADHSVAFWSSLAAVYANDPAVIFDLFNEPYDYWGASSDPWNEWLNGGTQKEYVTGGTPYSVTTNWTNAGMQQLVDAIRKTPAKQPLLINGLDWSNDDSGWLTHTPKDPENQIIAGAHIYPGESCDTTSCWASVYPSIAAKYPILIGETGDNSSGTASFLPSFLDYADGQKWSYLAWTWNPWEDSSNILVTDWNGTPTSAEGTVWKNHLAKFPFAN